MTNEEKRSCFTCKHHDLCYLRRNVHDAMIPSASWMFDPAGQSTWTSIFDTLAQACNQYTKMKGAETK